MSSSSFPGFDETNSARTASDLHYTSRLAHPLGRKGDDGKSYGHWCDQNAAQIRRSYESRHDAPMLTAAVPSARPSRDSSTNDFEKERETSGAVDLDRLADEVYELLSFRLAMERDRRGV